MSSHDEGSDKEVAARVASLSLSQDDGPTGTAGSVQPNGAATTSRAQSQGQCASSGCGKPAAMACPKCLELKRPPTLFCSQPCFKASWAEHRKLHKPAAAAGGAAAAAAGGGGTDPHAKTPQDSDLHPRFQRYDFSGNLRPWRVTPQMTVPTRIQRPDYADHPQGLPQSELRERNSSAIRVYNARQIAGIRRACQIGREVLDIAGRAVRAGVTTDEIDRVVYEACMERDAYPSPLNYYRFPKSVCTSVNEVICHGIPDMRELQEGDIVNIDVSTFYKGYHGDLNETFLVGQVDEAGQKLVRCAFDCLAAAIASIKPGNTMYQDVGKTISKVAAASGCSVVRTYCGHGIGELFHTNPTVPHYPKNKAKGTMKPGHVFTIEPMINLGDFHCDTWPDEWTAVTRDGSRSAQFEHTILITEDGYEILTARENEPVMEWKPELLAR